MMRKIKVLTIILSIVFLTSTFYAEILVDKIIARVNGSVITLSDFQIYKNMILTRFNKVPDDKILDDYISTEIVFQIAADENIEVKASDINNEIKAIQKQLNVFTEEAF